MRSLYRPKRITNKLKSNVKKTVITTIWVIIILYPTIKIINVVNTKGMEVAYEMLNTTSSTWINEAIQVAVSTTTSNMQIISSDFINMEEESIFLDTILVNAFCNEVATRLSSVLNDMISSKVHIPVGSLTGLEFLANTGPSYTISIMPMGNVLVDYDTSFSSVGINQTNFKVWLTINSSIKIVNPLQEKELKITRKVAIVNTVIKGEVPTQYFDGINIE